jgi:uncharacterized protein
VSTDLIRYDLLAQDALRDVIRRVLRMALRDGLPGNHHFYITFDTQHAGVKMSNRLREGFPQEMTIILQHQYWDLTVDDVGFSVGLSFKGLPEKIGMPYSAIKEFFDPSVSFGLKFDTGGEAAEEEVEKPVAKAPAAQRKISLIKAPEEVIEEPANEQPHEGAQIVSLDKFRKKK